MQNLEDSKLNIWMLDDDKSSFEAIKGHLDEQKVNLRWFSTSRKVKDTLENGSPPDLILLDNCLYDSDIQVISKIMSNNSSLSELAEISGIQFLTYLRCEWPNIPVLFISEYGDENPNIPPLQHAICFIRKSNLEQVISELAILSSKIIIGVNYSNPNSHIYTKISEIITSINSCQPHFHFKLISSNSDLATPNDIFLKKDNNNLIKIYQAWNNRALALINNVSKENNNGDYVYPILPFSKNQVYYHPIELDRYINIMGDDFLESLLLREFARTIYRINFKIIPHYLDTGECIFDESTNPTHFVKGIQRGRICEKCRGQINLKTAKGGWNNEKENSMYKLLQKAKSSLNKTLEIVNKI